MDIAALESLKTKIKETWTLLKLDESKQRVLDVEGKVMEPGFWNNQEQAKALTQELNELQKELQTWEQIQRDVDETIELAQMAENENDPQLTKDIEHKAAELQKRFEDLEFYILLSDKYDSSDAIVAVHAGAGGVDAQDWAEMLLRMVTRFCEQREWKIEMIDISRGGEAGIKSAVFHVKGRYAYGYLQSENGVHRLVRVSPFDAEGMRHTSFAMIEVIPDLGELSEIEIKDEELRMDVFRSGGSGGQGVNTTDSAVRITHLPTGIVVTCQNERSQHQNKATAMSILKGKLHKLYLEEQDAEKKKLRGEYASAEWGNQIRSYVVHPYKMVKDHRSEYTVNNPDAVLNGDLQAFMEAYLRWKQSRA